METIFRKCTKCGRNGAKVLSNKKYFCNECAELFGTCAMCVHGKKCEFNTNLTPIPKVISKRERQQTEMGYVEQVYQMPNPQRIKALCIEMECTCCKECEDGKFRCMRQFGTCEKYEEIEF